MFHWRHIGLFSGFLSGTLKPSNFLCNFLQIDTFWSSTHCFVTRIFFFNMTELFTGTLTWHNWRHSSFRSLVHDLKRWYNIRAFFKKSGFSCHTTLDFFIKKKLQTYHSQKATKMTRKVFWAKLWKKIQSNLIRKCVKRPLFIGFWLKMAVTSKTCKILRLIVV